ncbi:MAG: hypothetical protein U0736_09550 [Gemmataceae bacterium]
MTVDLICSVTTPQIDVHQMKGFSLESASIKRMAAGTPVDAAGNFVYVPIPLKNKVRLSTPGLERQYGEVLPALNRFSDGTRLRSVVSR